MTVPVSFSGEFQLLSWSETMNGGAKVTFQVSSPEELEYFKTLTARKGSTPGQRLMAVLVEIGEDEQPVFDTPAYKVENVPAPLRVKKAGLGPVALLAVMWCGTEQFGQWIETTRTPKEDGLVKYGFFKGDTPEARKAFICHVCSIDSRKELDTNGAAAKIWQHMIHDPYVAWVKGRK